MTGCEIMTFLRVCRGTSTTFVRIGDREIAGNISHMASLSSHTGTRRRFALLTSATLAVLILCSTCSCLQFSYPTFDAASEADFSFSPGSGIANGSLQITPTTGDISHRSGRVCYAREKLKLWNSEHTALTSFRTEFVLNILPRNGTGEGMAFILTNNPELPANSSGQWLGVTNGRTDGSPANRIVAVEFDTRKSGVDDLDGNHVGLDVNSVRSVSTYPLTNLSIVLSSGSDVSVSMQYDGAVLSIVAVQTYTFMYSWAGDLSRYLTENITVGFAASTGEFTELNQIKSWNFTTLGDDAAGRRGRRQARKRLILLLAYLIPLAVAGSFLAFCLWRRLTRPGRLAYRNLEKMIDARGPVRFGFRELRNATANFSSDRKLGRGSFGTVYLGYLSTGMEVAVKLKRVMASVGRSSRGEQEFVAEVNSISKLSHRNLVKLVGWCHERGELMLVYEYFPMGSLDKLLYADAGASGVAAATAPELTWERRYGIICGVAAALEYLHHGSSRRILHRDVKASNVMLDGGYGARLGDFGLARVVRSDGDTHHSTRAVAGTRGYMAPESFFTGCASLATDAYAFGVFVLEVVSGRRPSSPVPQHHSYLDDDDDLGGGDHDDAVAVAGGARRWREDAYVVDWAWRLYGEGRAWRAADASLGGAFDPEGVDRVMRLALACCHPDPRERPSMREAVQVLAGGVEAPEPPLVKPAFVWPPDGGRQQEMEMARVGVLFTGTGAHSSFCSMTSSSIISGR